MRVVEIFNSIDGEGCRAGKLATFIRTAGCNLRCSYCDTSYAQEMAQGQDMTVEQICEQVKEIGCHNITLTGGEPLLHCEAPELVKVLCRYGQVNIETNGTMPIEPFLSLKNTIITMDYKCPSSGCESMMRLENLELLRPWDVLKFVVSEDDFRAVREVLLYYQIRAQVYLSPVFGKVELPKIVGFVKRLHKEGLAENVRMQLQMHKIIWDPQKRGV